MKKKYKSISFWYIIVALMIISTLLWFFTEVLSVQKSQTISKIALESAKPIKNSFDTKVIEGLNKRIVISNAELDLIKPYTGNNSEKSVSIEKKVKPTSVAKSVTKSVAKVATRSAQPATDSARTTSSKYYAR